MEGKNQTERGQILVFFAIIVVGLLAVAALAIDGGYGYAIRRAAQNAADAGALAGARYYCAGETEAVWKQAVHDYAALNHDAVVEDIQLVNNLVYVKTSIEQGAFFSGVLGRNSIRAEAEAEAGCFIPDMAYGVLPIGFACREPVGGDSDEYEGYSSSPGSYECEVQFMDPWVGVCDAAGQPAGCYPFNPASPPGITGSDGEVLYLIMDNTASTAGDVECTDDDQPDVGFIDGTMYIDCDLDGDGKDDTLSDGGRGWLDLNGSTGGASELVEWIKNGYPYGIRIHTWVPQEGGDKASIFQAVKTYRLGKIVVVPVFDDICNGDPSLYCDGPDPEPDKYHNPDGTGYTDIIAPVPAGQKTYHVISFIRFFVTCVREKPSDHCPAFQAFRDQNTGTGAYNNGDFQSMRSIEGFFVAGFSGELLGKGQGGGPDLKNYIIYLNK